MPAIGFKTIEPPRWGDCGEFHWKVRFYITESEDASIRPQVRSDISWIVQHIKFDEQFEACEGEPPPVAFPHPDEYYELFCIGKDGWAQDEYDYGKDHVSGAENDTFGNDGHPGIKGNFSFVAEAYWLPVRPGGMTQKLLPSMMGDLEQSRSLPRGMDRNSWSLKRTVEGHWECCPHKEKKVSGKASAENHRNTADHVSYKETWVCKKVDEIEEHKKTVKDKDIAD